MILIDAHGPDHGLKVEVTGHEVDIDQWIDGSECDEPFGGVQTATFDLKDCLDHGRGSKSQRCRVIDGALELLSHRGGSYELMGPDEEPCDHFGTYWGEHQREWSRGMLTAECCLEYATNSHGMKLEKDTDR